MIEAEDGHDVFVHFTEIQNIEGYKALLEGWNVQFEMTDKREATNVIIIDEGLEEYGVFKI